MRLYRPLLILKLLFPKAVFRVSTGSRDLFLTFDDGPRPHSTPAILDVLDNNSIKALFFCSGKEAEKHPDLINLIKSKGHIIGNHGYNHLDGFRTGNYEYIEDVKKSARFTSPAIFRPPYGRIRRSQYKVLVKDYQIVFWDLMPYDFDIKMGNKRILHVLKKKIRPGSVIVLHDNDRKSPVCFLEDFIRFAKDKGYNFRLIKLSGKE
jgi:peptidoglycan/xylan/chitin deacetylase (PgdA/CDA1 family)